MICNWLTFEDDIVLGRYLKVFLRSEIDEIHHGGFVGEHHEAAVAIMESQIDSNDREMIF